MLLAPIRIASLRNNYPLQVKNYQVYGKYILLFLSLDSFVGRENSQMALPKHIMGIFTCPSRSVAGNFKARVLIYDNLRSFAPLNKHRVGRTFVTT